MTHPDSVLTLNPSYRMQYEPAQKSHVLLFPEGMVKLSPTAAEILELLDGKASVQQVINQLNQRYPDAPSLNEDVYQFIKVAYDKRWIC